MPDKKPTDNEIIKGLEICSNNGDCKECPINPHHGNYGYCTSLAIKAALDLINRLQAKLDEAEDTIQFADKELKKANTEIERLEAEIDKQYEIAEANVRAEIASGGTSCHWCEDKVRAEAYKEFAERLKDKHRRITDYDEAGFGAQIFIVEERVIDNLLKKLVGDNQ